MSESWSRPWPENYGPNGWSVLGGESERGEGLPEQTRCCEG